MILGTFLENVNKSHAAIRKDTFLLGKLLFVLFRVWRANRFVKRFVLFSWVTVGGKM